jgi:hypothetical protein
MLAPIEHSLVMDVTPWPRGKGFSGGNAWWDHVLSKDEQQRLDNLMGVALLDGDFREKLLNQRDDSLLAAFNLTEETRTWLKSIQAKSLVELAQAIASRL